jgi:hypothetical protein
MVTNLPDIASIPPVAVWRVLAIRDHRRPYGTLLLQGIYLGLDVASEVALDLKDVFADRGQRAIDFPWCSPELGWGSA